MKKKLCLFLLINLLFAAQQIQAQSIFKKSKDNADSSNQTASTNAINSNKADATMAIVSTDPINIHAYNIYDFVPGDTIIFEDHFTDDVEGEFPSHWHLGNGQSVMNTVAGQRAILLTDGNFAHISPLIKSAAYLPNNFTIEFDCYTQGGYGPHLFFYNSTQDAQAASNDKASIHICDGNIWAGIRATVGDPELDLGAEYPIDLRGDKYANAWHHVAIAYKNNQLKVYTDQYRVLVVPNLGYAPRAFDIEGIGDAKTPVVMANFRIAKGGNMNMLGKKFTDAKIITHGINFDVDKVTIKPESMGTLNMIAAVLKDNPDVKFAIGGHTDNSGAAAHNLTLSQQRADAVKAQLINMGVDAARLTSKGFGDTKPIADNNTFEGKAQNRRVEFVKF